MSNTPTALGREAAGGTPPPADSSLPHTRASKALEGFVRSIGRITSWIWAVLIAVIVYNVILRYVFGEGSIALEEWQWHLYAIGFMIGLSYSFVEDRHVRVDVLAERWGLKTRAAVELLGLLVLFIPFSVAIFIEAIPYVITSYELNEVSAAPSGLGYRWVLKSFLLWGFALLVLAAVARMFRCTALLFGWPRPINAR